MAQGKNTLWAEKKTHAKGRIYDVCPWVLEAGMAITT